MGPTGNYYWIVIELTWWCMLMQLRTLYDSQRNAMQYFKEWDQLRITTKVIWKLTWGCMSMQLNLRVKFSLDSKEWDQPVVKNGPLKNTWPRPSAEIHCHVSALWNMSIHFRTGMVTTINAFGRYEWWHMSKHGPRSAVGNVSATDASLTADPWVMS